MGLLSIMLARWWNLWEEVDNEADGYDDRLLLILGWIKLKVNELQ